MGGNVISVKRRCRGPAFFVLSCFLAGSFLVSPQLLQAQGQAADVTPANAARESVAPDFWTNRGHLTFGAQLGFALENNIGHNISHIAILMAQPSIGFIVRNFDTPGFPVSRFSMVSEGSLGGAIHPGGHLIGYALLLRLDGKPVHRVVPFFNCGAGILHTTINDRAPELSGHTQFDPQGGFGVQYFFNPQRAFVIEYRYMHVSNNSLQQPNLGFNSSMITIGFRWLRRSRPAEGQSARQRSVAHFLFGK